MCAASRRYYNNLYNIVRTIIIKVKNASSVPNVLVCTGGEEWKKGSGLA